MDEYRAGPTEAEYVMAPMPPVVKIGHVEGFLDDYALGLDLVPTFDDQDGKSLAPCWIEHPAAVTELTGIYLAWIGLIQALTGESKMVASPREWLDLTNATVPARERAIAATRNCQRNGKHVEPAEPGPRAGA
ncbi:MAG: hypothetical protein PSX37_11955 [bacterium]|nr:hypothetical protein [bacterium]